MKRIIIPLICLAMASLSSCGPGRHALHVEMRHPSKSGIELAGKTLSVIYLENDDPASDFFNEGMADGFAYALEQDYGTGEGSVGIYRMRCEDGVDYASRDCLLDLLVDTGADVVFLFDTLTFGSMTLGGVSKVAAPVSADSSYLNVGNVPFTMALHCFDAMDKSEKVHTFTGTSYAAPHAYSDGKDSSAELMEKAVRAMLDEGRDAGRKVAESFKSVWKHEQYSLVYFNEADWYKALDRAEVYDWKGAMDMWMSLLSTKDMLKRACAEYNLATACYMLGDYDLAIRWLDQSDRDNKLQYSEGLRKRIQDRRP